MTVHEVDLIDTRIETLVAERDRAREECGHEKAMRRSACDQLDNFVRLKMDRDKRIAAALDLAAQLDPASGSGRVRTFVADLTRILRGDESGQA